MPQGDRETRSRRTQPTARTQPDGRVQNPGDGSLDPAIGYARVSTEEQVLHGFSIDAQTDRIRAYCVAAGLDLIDIVREEGVSGGKRFRDRPGGSTLSSVLQTRAAVHLVVMKLDRLFRDAEDALSQTRQWDKAGIAVHIIDMGGSALNTRSATGRMFLTMAAGFAEMERALIAERTVAALDHKKKTLRVYSPVPYGFNRDGGSLVPNPEETAVIGKIRAWRKEKRTLRNIADRLNGDRVPTKTGRHWHASTVAKILANSLHS